MSAVDEHLVLVWILHDFFAITYETALLATDSMKSAHRGSDYDGSGGVLVGVFDWGFASNRLSWLWSSSLRVTKRESANSVGPVCTVVGRPSLFIL